MINGDSLAKVVQGGLELAGASPPAAQLLGGSIVDLLDWAESEFAGGRDPKAALKALMNTADVEAKAVEDAELGGG